MNLNSKRFEIRKAFDIQLTGRKSVIVNEIFSATSRESMYNRSLFFIGKLEGNIKLKTTKRTEIEISGQQHRTLPGKQSQRVQ